MKTFALAMIGAAALLLGAAHAQTIDNGYAGISYEYRTGDGTETYTYDSELDPYAYKDDFHSNDIGLHGAVSLPVTSLIGVQADLSYDNARTTVKQRETLDGVDTGYNYRYSQHVDEYAATGHVFARTDEWTAGAFFGYSSYGTGSLVGGGVEGQYFHGPLTLQGAVGVAKNNPSYGGYYDYYYYGMVKPTLWAVRGDARWFFSQDLSADVNVGYMDGSGDSTDIYGDRFTIDGPALWTVGISAEYKFKDKPFSVLASYEHGESTSHFKYSYFDDGTYTEDYRLDSSGDAFKIAFRWNFGGSLADRNNRGASLNSFKQTFGDEFEDASSDLAAFLD